MESPGFHPVPSSKRFAFLLNFDFEHHWNPLRTPLVAPLAIFSLVALYYRVLVTKSRSTLYGFHCQMVVHFGG